MKIGYKSGDIVLCPMMFSNGVGSKYRPVVILSEDRGDYLVSSISSQLHQGGKFDIYITSDDENNLRTPESVIRLSVLSTVSGELIKSQWGNISPKDWIQLKINMQNFIKSW